jgi:hypothetical protein
MNLWLNIASRVQQPTGKQPQISLRECPPGTGIPSDIRERSVEALFTIKRIKGETGLCPSTAFGIAKSHEW